MTEPTKLTGDMFTKKPLKGQHALVTGGSRGIGAAVSNYLARLGANISLTGRTKKTLTAQAEHLISEFEVQVFTAIGDMSQEQDVKRCFSEAVETLSSVNILINNAGVGKSAPFHRMDTDFWNTIIGLNLTGTFLCTKQVIGAMRDAGYGRIVNISSTVGLRGYPYIAAYCASKHGVIGLTRTLALECVKKGITVNAICPGFIATPLAAVGRDRVAETQVNFAKSQPWPEFGDGVHIAGAALFLASEDARFVTGEHIVVDGGLTAAGPELSRRFPRGSARDSRVVGVTKGSTGEAADITRLDA